MAPGKHGGGRAANQKLDNDVYAIVRTIIDKQEDDSLPSSTSLYEQIQRSNSRLARQKKTALVPSIERVLEQMRTDNEDEDSLNGDIVKDIDLPEEADAVEKGSRSVNDINRQIVAAWRHDEDKSNQQPNGTSNLKRVKPRDHGEPPLKKRKTTTQVDRTAPTRPNFSDLGGLGDVVTRFQSLLIEPMAWPEKAIKSGRQPTTGILLHGPSGCGKTTLANAVAAEIGASFISISAPSIVSGMSGESEKVIRDYFDEAKKIAPCLMFIDEIDAITPKRESAQREMERRIVAQLLTCMDELSLVKTNGKAVVVLAATNRPDSLDPALRRAGRFSQEIHIPVPTEATRVKILTTLTSGKWVSQDVDTKKLARATPGYVGADLQALVTEAGAVADKRAQEELLQQAADADVDMDDASLEQEVRTFRLFLKLTREQKAEVEATGGEVPVAWITDSDFMTALPRIQPAAKREGFATVPDTTWADIGALTDVRKELMLAIVEPVRNPESFQRLGLRTASGTLLYGPPGCGKTLLARAVANESGANFISIKGPELLNKFVGESERAVRQVFTRARSSVPCMIFIDEIDALLPKRDDTRSEASSRVVNMFLAELDGVDKRGDIHIVGATNRPDIIDPAILRPGRLENRIYVGLPGSDDRVQILRTLTQHLTPISGLDELARSCEGYSGADLDILVRKAKIAALQRDDGVSGVTAEDFNQAASVVRPSVGEDALANYERMKKVMQEAH